MPSGLLKIVSGGQTGADRAALDWALANDVACGGWCPLGRWAEDGVIDARYPLRETPEPNPAQRTEWNIRDSDGTLIVSLAKRLFGGTRLTEDLAKRLAKPHLVLSKTDGDLSKQAETLVRFIAANEIAVLNVAGPRASGEPNLAGYVTVLLDRAIGQVGLA
ncbi:MAG: putative molybdenum carrier protein [Verrucomicrobiota bacterium]|nr:putative molybdenum carrier protein [Verrucomicrobiota bacterium]